jgi:hypothetical protein
MAACDRLKVGVECEQDCVVGFGDGSNQAIRRVAWDLIAQRYNLETLVQQKPISLRPEHFGR